MTAGIKVYTVGDWWQCMSNTDNIAMYLHCLQDNNNFLKAKILENKIAAVAMYQVKRYLRSCLSKAYFQKQYTNMNFSVNNIIPNISVKYKNMGLQKVNG